MKARSLPLFALITLTVLLTSACDKKASGLPDGELLKGPEIEKLFSDHTVRGTHKKVGYSFESYYDKAGKFRSYQDGAKKPKEGTWHVKGDEICVRWDDVGEKLCRNMIKDGQGKYWKVLIKGNGKRIPIVAFESFEAGNPKKL